MSLERYWNRARSLSTKLNLVHSKSISEYLEFITCQAFKWLTSFMTMRHWTEIGPTEIRKCSNTWHSLPWMKIKAVQEHRTEEDREDKRRCQLIMVSLGNLCSQCGLRPRVTQPCLGFNCGKAPFLPTVWLWKKLIHLPVPQSSNLKIGIVLAPEVLKTVFYR